MEKTIKIVRDADVKEVTVGQFKNTWQLVGYTEVETKKDGTIKKQD